MNYVCLLVIYQEHLRILLPSIGVEYQKPRLIGFKIVLQVNL